MEDECSILKLMPCDQQQFLCFFFFFVFADQRDLNAIRARSGKIAPLRLCHFRLIYAYSTYSFLPSLYKRLLGAADSYPTIYNRTKAVN
jgi:hypothetical protein